MNLPSAPAIATTAAEQKGINLTGVKDFCQKNRSSQGQNLVLTVLIVPNSLDTGMPTPLPHQKPHAAAHTPGYYQRTTSPQVWTKSTISDFRFPGWQRRIRLCQTRLKIQAWILSNRVGCWKRTLVQLACVQGYLTHKKTPPPRTLQ